MIIKSKNNSTSRSSLATDVLGSMNVYRLYNFEKGEFENILFSGDFIYNVKHKIISPEIVPEDSLIKFFKFLVRLKEYGVRIEISEDYNMYVYANGLIKLGDDLARIFKAFDDYYNFYFGEEVFEKIFIDLSEDKEVKKWLQTKKYHLV